MSEKLNFHRINKIRAHLKKNKVIQMNCFTIPWILHKGAFTNNIDTFLSLFDHLPSYFDIFFFTNVGKEDILLT
jgi:hypothetical protein